MISTEISSSRRPALRGIVDTATYVIELAAIAAGYIGLAATGLFLPAINPLATPLWPPTGLAISLLLLRGYRIWPAILVGSFCSNVIAGRPLLALGPLDIGTLLAALAGTWLINRWSEGRNTFITPFGVVRFALISFAPTAMISSAGAVGASILAQNISFGDSAATWAAWWLADAIGTLFVAPLVVLWAMARFTKSDFLETVAMLVLAATIGIAAYSPIIDSELVGNGLSLLSYRSMLAFLILFPLMWAGLRANRHAAATAAFVFFAFALWGFSAGADPFPKANLNGSLLLLLALALSITIPPLLLTAAIATHSNSEKHLLAAQKQLLGELSQSNLSLQSTKRHLQILIEGVTDYAIFLLDTAGHVASWNSSAQKIIGYSADEIIGKHFGIFYRPDERRAGEANHALELAAEKGRHQVEGWRIRKNGTLLFVTGSVSAIRDDAGKLVGFANVIRDTTERRDAQEKLVQAREQLVMAQKMEAIGKLTGGIAHDFNNLLMIIGGNAQTFRRLLDPKLPRAIEAIQIAAKRGESLTRQLLTFSRRQHLSPTVVDLSTSLRNMRTMIESSLRGNIVYNENIGAKVWPVKVDLAELELAIVNLAVNSRDAMPNGGTFTLSVHNVAAQGDGHRNSDNAACVSIEVNDTGTGIPPNLLSKIFDPFFTTKEVGKGTGLGLSQVYGFAHQAGGTVRAESTVGKGTTVTICLPPHFEREVVGKEVPVADIAQTVRPTVLIIDDSAEVAEVTSSLFEHLGYDTVYRDSAEAALKLLEEGMKFDLVFSDIVMPGAIDGVGLASEIRARYPDLPVILTTGYSDAAQAAPADLRILRKPFDTDALRSFIQNSVKGGSAVH